MATPGLGTYIDSNGDIVNYDAAKARKIIEETIKVATQFTASPEMGPQDVTDDEIQRFGFKLVDGVWYNQDNRMITEYDAFGVGGLPDENGWRVLEVGNREGIPTGTLQNVKTGNLAPPGTPITKDLVGEPPPESLYGPGGFAGIPTLAKVTFGIMLAIIGGAAALPAAGAGGAGGAAGAGAAGASAAEGAAGGLFAEMVPVTAEIGAAGAGASGGAGMLGADIAGDMGTGGVGALNAAGGAAPFTSAELALGDVGTSSMANFAGEGMLGVGGAGANAAAQAAGNSYLGVNSSILDKLTPLQKQMLSKAIGSGLSQLGGSGSGVSGGSGGYSGGTGSGGYSGGGLLSPSAMAVPAYAQNQTQLQQQQPGQEKKDWRYYLERAKLNQQPYMNRFLA